MFIRFMYLFSIMLLLVHTINISIFNQSFCSMAFLEINLKLKNTSSFSLNIFLIFLHTKFKKASFILLHERYLKANPLLSSLLLETNCTVIVGITLAYVVLAESIADVVEVV